jgi:hypothetical protein
MEPVGGLKRLGVHRQHVGGVDIEAVGAGHRSARGVKLDPPEVPQARLTQAHIGKTPT